MPENVAREPIAIVGMGCVLPDAPDVATFWDNLLAGKSSIREVPKTRWDPDLFWSADKGAPDKTYAKIGAFVQDDAFNPLDYRMPPGVVAQIDPSQRWALSATRQAFRDAGYKSGLKGDAGKEFDRARCAVILGNAMGGELMKLHTKRLYWPQVEAALRSDPSFSRLGATEQDATLRRAEGMFKSDSPPITEDSMPGTLSNVAAGRIANLFDLAGKNFTTDAACASSLAALDAAVDCLRKRESDIVVWGGTDRSMDITPYVEFSKIGALSPDGSRPFDAEANGFVMGEGCAVFLLKRLSDAERDGDKIYAVIRGIGSSSDGKGKGITAPNPAGQLKAVIRAYEDAGIDPYTLGYVEAHGTSTPVGDPVELQSAEEAFRVLSRRQATPGSILVGSVKSNMGHLKSAAGAVGLLKTALALRSGVLPPSINVRSLNPRIDWAKSPFRVVTQRTEWPRIGDHPRRAAVSSFGFGGTNFHVVVEEYVRGAMSWAPSSNGAAATSVPLSGSGAPRELDVAAFASAMASAAALEPEALVLDAATAAQAAEQVAGPIQFAATGQGPRLRDRLHPYTAKGLAAGARVGLTVQAPEDIPKRLEQAQKAASNPAQARLAFNQGVFVQKGRPQGKVAFLFPGQGTQYVNMFRDLAQKYEVVRNTFDEADRLLLDELGGVKLTDILWPTPDTPQAQAAAEEKLKLTEFTQPAVLAADVAILRLLRQWGIEPDVVAGHSLGEYGALVAAGVLGFADALHAVAARGREMAHVEVPDLGKMASVSADWHAVTEAVKSVADYVIPANKNCPSQTVIAGSSKGVDAAVALLQAKGMQAQYLPVSAAFHSAIVAPASKPLRNVLARLDVKSPKVRVLSNVGAQPYQDDVEWIRDNLATQVASPVEWIDIVERMYDEGVRTFIEVGPKPALTNFVRDILKERPDAVAIGSNHPKKGGIAHANELFAFLGAWGFAPRLPALDDPAVYTKEFRDPTASFRTLPPQAASAVPAQSPATSSEGPVSQRLAAVESLLRQVQAEVAKSAAAPTTQVGREAGGRAGTQPPALESELRRRLQDFGICLDDIGVSGISVGLPGKSKPLFDDANWDRVIAGENLIDPLDAGEREKIVDKNIVRLAKSGDGSAQFQVVSDIAQVIQLAGQRGGFDIKEYGVEDDLAEALDRTFQYAIAAGLEALRNAGIPLQRTYLQTSQGGYLPKEWKLPAPLRDETGVIFASAFPGFDNLVRDVSRYLADRYNGKTREELQSLYDDLIGTVEDPESRGQLQDAFDREFQRLDGTLEASGTARYEFNRKFLFRVLSMGHSQLAQFIGARGPNTQVNAACASTTQAIAIAEDWIRTGRARRVLVVGADDITNSNLFEWFGAGFLAAGAATTKAKVEDAALPFDRRRHGMIVGMGAVGLVVEAAPETEKRGMRPIARLLATRVSNSAYHGSRLDVDHVASEMVAMMGVAERRYGVKPLEIAPRTLFMSHETYTPARGGSAAAEIHALRAAFGPMASKVVVANTKGFTGHPQGASIEDAIALKCLQRGTVPPIANLRDPDPELGDLNLSKGGRYDVRYAVRLAAGFGSQIAMALFELVAREAEQMADPGRHKAWMGEVSGLADAKTEVVHRTLRLVDQGPPPKRPVAVTAPAPAQMATAVAAPPPTPAPMAPNPPRALAAAEVRPAGEEDVLARLITLVAEKTGYPKDLLDPNLDMEADLGIDTVKQAELFGAIREAYGLPQEQDIQIKDYPTLAKVAGYVQSRIDAMRPSQAPLQAPTAAPAGSSPPPSALAPIVRAEAGTPASPPPAGGADADVLRQVTLLVAAKTGYPAEMLEPDLDMEADLGIDTVKQAELFADVRATFGIAPVDGLQLKDYPTLRKVAQFALQQGTSRPAPATATFPGQPAAAAAPSQILRRVPTLRPQHLPDTPNAVPRGVVLLVGDHDEHMAAALSEAGFTPVHDLKGDQRPIGLVAIAARPGPGGLERVGPVFDAAKQHRASLAGGFVLAITRQDGGHGLQHPRDPSMAALAGLAKALAKEFPQATVKAVDLHPETNDGANRAVQELLRGGRRTEIAYGRDGQRFVIEVAPQELPALEVDVEGKGIVVSGGAQGITVELLAALAPQHPKLLLLGRTQLPDEAAAWAALGEAGWKAMEADVMAQMREHGEKVTPVAIQKAMQPRQKAAEVHRNLARLTDLGATVLYAPIDVADPKAVTEAVDWARGQFGAIHGVIHAAGIEVSKDLASKDRAQFEAVFQVKAKGWDALMAATRDDRLETLVAFGSVAGRFGNLGQTDYSAANEYLAKAVKLEAQRRKCLTGTTIAWGPWGEVGMATKGSILHIMQQSGVTPIPTRDGIAHFLRELGTPGVRESVVAGQLGAIDADGQVVAQGWDLALAIANQVLRDHPERFRMLDGIEAIVPDQSLVARVVLDQARDAAMKDHRVDGVPFLPGVLGLEAFAEAASLLAPKDTEFLGAQDVRFALPVKQLKPAPAVARIHARTASRPNQPETSVECRLSSQFLGPDGTPLGEPRLHFEATLRFGTMAQIPKAAVPKSDGSVTPAAIYPPFFHGPSFQVLAAAGPLGPEALAQFREPTEQAFGAGPAQYTAMPMLLEGLFQVCGLQTLKVERVMSLPAGIRRVEAGHVGPLPKDVRLRGRSTGRDAAGNRTFDAEAASADGRLLLRIQGFAMVETGPVAAADIQQRGAAPTGLPVPAAGAGGPGSPVRGASAAEVVPAGGNRSAAVPAPPAAHPAIGVAGGDAPASNGAAAQAADPGIALPDVEDVHFAAVAVSGHPAAASHFTEAELATYGRFPVAKRKDEWRAGRLAAKQAVLDTHPGLSPRDVEVQGDEKGRPRILIKGQEAALWLSISHRDGHAIAAVSTAPVGVDLETVEERPRSFLEEAFSVQELKSLLAEPREMDMKLQVACLWAAKEAALKRAGVGLKADLRAHTVAPDGEGGAVVAGPQGRFGVRFFMVEGKVCAVSAPPLDPALKASTKR